MKTTVRAGLIVGALLWATAVRAQGNPPPAFGNVAERLFYEGLDALGRRDYERAREDFEASVALVPRGSAFRNLATVDWALGRHVDALRHLRAALELPDLPSELRERAQKDIDAAYAATGHIAVSADPGASVRVDGTAIGGPGEGLERPVDVEPGVRLVEARLGDRIGRAEVNAKAGIVVNADVVLPSLASPIVSIPAPAPVLPQAETPPTKPYAPSPFWNTRRAVGAAVGAAGVGTLAVGLAYLGAALGDERRARSAESGLGPSSCAGSSPPASCAALHDATSAQANNAQISRVLVATGALIAAAGAVVVLWPEAWPRGIAAAPTVGTTDVGLQLAGSF